MKAPNLNVRQIYSRPAVLAIVSFVGLVSALVGDGLWGGLSWVGLSIPLAVIAYFLRRARR